MPDLEIKINSMYPPGASGGIRAYASVTMDGCLGIRGVKVVEGGRSEVRPVGEGWGGVWGAGGGRRG